MHHRCQAGFIIHGATPVQFPITNHWVKGINRHALDRDRVRVRLKDDAAGRITARNASDDIVAPWKYLLLPDLDASRLEKTPHIRRRFFFTRSALVRAVDAIDADEV